ncbi:MAG: hypothetical protein OQK49_06790, partial [Proteobacteria bacterium]|nr:hypothetical protein [Pseudomonadota bacterium]
MTKKPLYLAMFACMASTTVYAEDVNVMVKGSNTDKQLSQSHLIEDYGQFKIYRMPVAAAKKL